MFDAGFLSPLCKVFVTVGESASSLGAARSVLSRYIVCLKLSGRCVLQLSTVSHYVERLIENINTWVGRPLHPRNRTKGERMEPKMKERS